MKKIKFLILLVVTAVVVVSCKENNPKAKVNKENVQKAQERNSTFKGAPEIKLDKEVFEFGTVNQGDVVENYFIVTNTGKSDLIISEAKPSCGCTVPTWPKDPIAPGDSGKINFKFDTAGKSNKQSKNITLITNTEKGREVLRISGNVLGKNKKS